MEQIHSVFLPVHIAAGCISIVIFWIPVFVRKGSKSHNLVGRWYINSMVVVLFTSMVLSVNNIFKQEYILALFLIHLTFLTAFPLWHGYTILKRKKTSSKGFKKMRSILLLSLGISSIVCIGTALLLWYSYGRQDILLIIFGILGLSSAKDIFNKPVFSNRVAQHLDGMIVSGIAAYTAFFAFGGRTLLGSLLEGNLMIIPWILPTVIGIIAIRLWKRKYTGKPQKPVAMKIVVNKKDEVEHKIDDLRAGALS